MEDSMTKNQNGPLQNFKGMKTIMYLQIRQWDSQLLQGYKNRKKVSAGVLEAQQSKGPLCLTKMGKVVLTGLLP